MNHSTKAQPLLADYDQAIAICFRDLCVKHSKMTHEPNRKYSVLCKCLQVTTTCEMPRQIKWTGLTAGIVSRMIS